MKIAILGSGLAGCLTAGVLSLQKMQITIIAPEISALKEHKAVLRVKNPLIAMFLGNIAREITVHKGIWSNGALKNAPSIRDNNLYSIKVYGAIGNRSILSTGFSTEGEKRYLLEGEIIPKCSTELFSPNKIVNNTICAKEAEIPSYVFDFCISTLPMPITCRLVGMAIDTSNEKFVTSPITILHFKTAIKTTTSYQTIYYPEIEDPLYRATLQDGIVITETIGSISAKKITQIEKIIKKSFGLTIDTTQTKKYIQPRGKIHEIDEKTRKKILYTLTTKHNIFSVGRYAIWKPIRADQLLNDIFFIIRLMESREGYDILKGREEIGK